MNFSVIKTKLIGDKWEFEPITGSCEFKGLKRDQGISDRHENID